MPPRLPIRLNALRPLLRRAIDVPEASYSLRPRMTAHLPTGGRKISSTQALQRKKEVKKPKDEDGTIIPDDRFGLEILKTDISNSLERLKVDLDKLRTGGRFNPEALENVPVRLVKDSKETFRLGDLAQIIPKGGRSYAILASEADHVKPILSAIQSSNELNLQPQPDAQNPLQLVVPIPPPTKESRDLALKAATAAGQKAKDIIGSKRAILNKQLRAWELAKKARPDDLKKAEKEMNGIAEKGAKEVTTIVDASKKNMQQ